MNSAQATFASAEPSSNDIAIFLSRRTAQRPVAAVLAGHRDSSLAAAHSRVHLGPSGRRRFFLRVLLEPGADDTIFPLALAGILGVTMRLHAGHGIRWRGQSYPLQFGDTELELRDGAKAFRWPAVIGFSTAPIHYPILGLTGCLQFFNAHFHGESRFVELNVNPSYPGITQ